MKHEHNCKKCKNGNNFEIHFDIYINCYMNCSFYHYYDGGISYCTKSNECINEFDKLIEDKSECVSNCTKDDQYKYEFRMKCFKECPKNSTNRENSTELDIFCLDKRYFCKPICTQETPFEMILTQECVKNCPVKSLIDKSCILNFKSSKDNKNEGDKENEDEKEEMIKAIDTMIQNVETGFTSDDYDTSGLESGNNDVFEYGQMTITLTTTQNQKSDKENADVTTIDLGECEQLLREAYQIPDNEMIYMKKIDVIQEGMKIPKVEYDVYSKLNGSNLIKLNLSYCSNSKVDISVPIEITESLDKLNTKSGYYNDICYTTTSDSGTDIILNDRKTEFVEGNKTVCQDNCIFADYDNKLQKAKCSCDVVESSSSFANININKTKLYENFVNFRNIANINLLKCYKVLFTTKGISKNYGSLSLMPLLLIHFIIIILFYAKNLYKKIEDKINDISYGITNWDLVKEEEMEKKKKQRLLLLKKRKNRFKKLKIRKKQHNEEEKKEKTIYEKYNIQPPIYLQYRELMGLSNIAPPIYYQYKNYINEIDLRPDSNPPFKKNNRNKSIKLDKNNTNNRYFNNQKEETIGNKNIKGIKFSSKETKNKALKKVKKVMAYNDEELNNLKYELAMKFDKRSYCQYYLSLLITKHDIMFTFFNNSDYNSKIVKIDLFLFNFSLNYTVNTLFFNDNTMHQIYEDKGSFNIIYQLPQIAYSFLISTVFNILLKMLALSEGLILDFKNQKNVKDLEARANALDKKIKIKFALYFLLSTIFLLFFWYYISMFCAIYVNTQIHLIKDTLISFATSFIYPLVINLIPGIFRIPALSNPKNKSSYLYTLSKLLQMI